jgi:hypothetical protein
MFNAVSRSERNLSSLEVTDLTDAPKSHFLEPSQRIYPTGKSAKTCQAPFAKIFLFFRMANQVYKPDIPCPQEGRFAIVTNVGQGMRWTQQPQARKRRRMRFEADGKIVWSWRPDAGVKSAGFSCRRRWQKSPVTGESTKISRKTIARGKPG